MLSTQLQHQLYTKTKIVFRMSFVSSSLLMGTGVVHCAFGFAVPELREPFVRILSEGTVAVADIGDRYQREASYWFQFGGIMMMSHGYLLRNYCQETGKSPPNWFGWYLTCLSGMSLIVMPESGFWLVLGQGIYMIYSYMKAAKKKLE